MVSPFYLQRILPDHAYITQVSRIFTHISRIFIANNVGFPDNISMKLDDYLFEKGLTVKDFADSIGYVDRYISGIKNLRYPLTRQVNQRVLHETGGLVNLQQELEIQRSLSESSNRIRQEMDKLKQQQEPKWNHSQRSSSPQTEKPDSSDDGSNESLKSVWQNITEKVRKT